TLLRRKKSSSVWHTLGLDGRGLASCRRVCPRKATARVNGGFSDLKDETDMREEDSGPSTGETIKSLNEQLGAPSLKSSTSILILILLTMNKKMSSVKLRTLTGLGKGS